LRGIERVAFRPTKNAGAEFQNDPHELLEKFRAVPRRLNAFGSAAALIS
jgi:hypothetical protein